MKSQGFTLIELLIVVAIIAILAAIAVPNFIEAQTRSKVSRGKTDMRSEATALESYMTDWGSYPPYGFPYLYHGWPAVPPPPDAPTIPGTYALTTPVAYMSALPRDVFPSVAGEPYACHLSGSKYLGRRGANCRGGTQTDPLEDWKPWPKDMYLLITRGPDGTTNMTSQRFPDAYDSGRTVHVYDASNGTRSVGDIMRWVCPARYNLIFEVGYDPGKDIDPTDGQYIIWSTEFP